MKYKIIGNTIRLYDSYYYRDAIKRLPGRKWDSEDKAWYFIDNELIRDILNNMFGFDIPVEVPSEQSHEEAGDLKIGHLYDHQKRTVSLERKNKLTADLSEPGTGKTLSRVEMILERNTFPVLIICPKSLINAVWYEELANHFAPFRVCALNGGTDKNIKKLRTFFPDNDRNIYIINYESFWRVEEVFKKHIRPKYIILDESTKIKNHKAKQSKAILRIRDLAEYRTIMTGTVAPNGLLDIFNQYRFVSPKIFGESYYAFRYQYFFNIAKGAYNEWIIKPEAIGQIKKKISQVSVQHIKRQCVDLPPITYEKRYVEMGANQSKVYKQAKEDFLIWLGDQQVINLSFAITQMMKLRQITSGFVYHNEQTVQIKDGDKKLNELLDLIESIGQKVIVFIHFTESGRVVYEHLKNKFDVIIFGKGNRDDNIEQFKNSNKQKVLIANPKSAGHGLNLQFCSNIIYYELDFGLESYLQSIDRINRIGQKSPMTVYYLLTPKSIDIYIYDKLLKKQDINDSLKLESMKNSI